MSLDFLHRWYEELERRKVLRVAAAYAVVAWGVIEVAETVFPILELPDWLVTAVTVLAILGFPLAVALAWAFDVTERGVERADGRETSAGSPHRSRVGGFWVVIGLAAVAVVAWTILGNPGEDATRPDRSVAVLPFANLSGVAENEFFSDGITEDILTNLSNISGLRVISRTSAMTYKGSDKTIPEIAEELRVSYVLEGSVRRAGDRVRITVQLIHAPTDRHVWAENYDRQLTDIFAIQSEIARAIAGQLRTELSAEERERLGSKPTEDMAAYDQYLKGRALLDQRSSSGMRRAIDHFQRAIARDSAYALAWAGLADAVSLLEFYAYPVPDSVPSALDAAGRAVAIDETLGHAQTSLGIAYSLRQRGPAALRHLDRAVELTPGYAEAHAWLGWVQLLTGNPEEALRAEEEAIRQDPLAPAFHVYLGESLLATGDGDGALRHARRAIELQSEYGLAHFMEGLALHHLGRFTGARASYERARGLVPRLGTPTHAEIDAAVALSRVAEGDTAGARTVLHGPIRQATDADAVFSVGLLHAALGELDPAFAAFGRVSRWGSFSTDHLRYFFPELLAPLRADPRYAELMETVDRAWGMP